MAHAYNASYSRGRDQEDCSWKPAWQIVHKTLSQKTHHKKRAGGVAQGVDPELRPQYAKHKQINKQTNK
jgi:hypothetical protein